MFTHFKLFIILFILLSSNCLALNHSKLNFIDIDTRKDFNSNAVYVEKLDKEFIVYETIKGFDFDSISLSIAELIHMNSGDLKLSSTNTLINMKNYNSLVGTVLSQNENWIYFAVSDGFRDPALIKRGKLTKNGSIVDFTNIELDFDINGRSFPQIYYNNNQFFLAYRKAKCCGLGFAKSKDGISFQAVDSFKKSGHMPALSSFNNNSLLYSYQRPYPTNKMNKNGKPFYVMKSRFRISTDNGESWGEEKLVSESVYEVHDAFTLQRQDGLIDIYYSDAYKRVDGDWSLWRRCIDKSGNVGKEELVVDEQVGNIAKPSVQRRGDGSIALSFIEQGHDITKGAIQYFTILENDAVCSIN